MPNALLDRLQALDAAKRTKLDSANAILAKLETEQRSAMTADELTAFNTLTKEAEEVQLTIDATNKLAAVMPTGNTPNNSVARTGASQPKVYDNILDKPWVPEAPTAETTGQRWRRMTYAFGQYLSEIKNAELRQKVGERGDARLYRDREAFEKRAQAAGSSEMVPSDGGFLMAPDFAQEVLMLAHDTGLIYPRTRQVPLSEFTNAIKIPAVDEQSRKDGSRFGGVQMFWENEAQALTGAKPAFALLEMVTKKLTGLYYATNEVLADARLLGAIAMMAFGEEFAFKLDDGVIRGTGAGQLSGILNANCLITINKETGQASQTVVFENIKKMWGRMWPRSRGNSVWLVNVDVEQQLMGMSQVVGTGGVPVYLPPGAGTWGAAAGTPLTGGTLFGRPVVIVEHAATLGTTGDIILADFNQFLMIDKGDLQTATSVHVRFLTDEMTFRWIYRTDGQPWWKTALTPFQGTNTLSPFVVVQSR